MSEFFIVTGAGRSGTSAVARVLHESGLPMGRTLAGPSEANPEGFYEDLAVVELNERILGDVGMNTPWRSERWPSRAAIRSAGRPYESEMRALARDASGWKDPRFALTLEVWLPALPVRPKVVLCLRSPQAYADSSTRIYGLVTRGRAMREWARHYQRLLAVLARHKLEATCIEYDALIEWPDETIAELSRFAGKQLDASYVVPRLRRERAPVPPAYRELYERVARLGPDPLRAAVTHVEGQRQAGKPTHAYESLIADIVGRVTRAKNEWAASVGALAPTLATETRGACIAYNDLLMSAQAELAALTPPAQLAARHRRFVRRVNLERMISELASSAAAHGDGDARRAALLAFRAYSGRPLNY